MPCAADRDLQHSLTAKVGRLAVGRTVAAGSLAGLVVTVALSLDLLTHLPVPRGSLFGHLVVARTTRRCSAGRCCCRHGGCRLRLSSLLCQHLHRIQRILAM